MSFDWSEFEVSYYYPSSLEQVFRAWSTCEGLKSFFIEKIEVTDSQGARRKDREPFASGDEYSWTWRHDYSISGKFTCVVPNERAEFTFGSMQVSVSLKRVKDATLLQLKQTQIPLTEEARPTSHMNCRICWTFFLTNLKSVLMNGTDLRDPIPARASSFEVGFQAPEV